jgi:6-pyruvoyltetrahydropterin/6-carboxytetrahydropterin synthase
VIFRDRIEVAFDAGHRLLDYQGKCANPHGHTYRAELFLEGRDLDALGLLVDFGDMKREFKGWIDAQWDHAFLLNQNDVGLREALQSVPEAKLYCFPCNPSAEVMAGQLLRVACGLFPEMVASVRVWEGQNQYAEAVKTAEHR